MRALAVEANRAHNLEVVGSNPTPATNFTLDGLRISVAFFHSQFVGGLIGMVSLEFAKVEGEKPKGVYFFLMWLLNSAMEAINIASPEIPIATQFNQ
jgi:hypothetical protein